MPHAHLISVDNVDLLKPTKQAYNSRSDADVVGICAANRSCVMTNIAKILPLANVLLNLEVSSKKRAFEQAGLLFENNCSIARSTVSDNLFARERLGSTGLGHGVAIPHGRIKGLKAPIAAFVRLAEPIPFESPDAQPVDLLIFLLMPDNVTQQHLEILSEVAEMLSNEQFRDELRQESNPEAIYHKIVAWRPNLEVNS